MARSYLRFAGTVFVVLVSGMATFVVFFHPFDIAAFLVFWIVWLVAVASCLVAARHAPGRVVRSAAFILWLVCAVLAGTELALRLVAWKSPSPLFARLDASLEKRLSAFRISSPYFLGFPINSQGWNDEEFREKQPGILRVVSISDSFAWGGTPHYFHFSTVWERRAANVEVANLGYPGTELDSYLYILKYYGLSLDPDLIVVNIYVGNDIVPAPPAADPGFLRRWFDRDNLMTYSVAVRVMKIVRENSRKRRDLIAVETPRNEQRPIAGPEPRNRGEIPRLVLGPNWQIEGNLREIPNHRLPEAFPWLMDPRLEPPTYSRQTYIEMAARRARNICYLLGQDTTWRPVFFDYVEKIIDAAGNARVVFVLIPDEFQIEDDLWRQVELESAVALDRGLPQRELTRWFDEHGVEYLDLLPLFLSVPLMEDGRRHLFHRQDTHLNRRGNELVGRALAAWFSHAQ